MKRQNRVASGKVASGRGEGVRHERPLSPPPPTPNPQPSRRGGAALIVVLSLLGTLAFLGLLFYTFAAQELANARNFAAVPTAAPSFGAFANWGMKQLIVGTPPSLEDSALYGSNWAIVPNMIGRPDITDELLPLLDVNPYDGLGIGVWADNAGLAAGDFIFDYTGDGIANADQSNFILNFSPTANAGAIPTEIDDFHPDAGYTYPDVNSMFMAFDGFVRDPNTGNEYRVIIPSFHRPQYFPAKRGLNAGQEGQFGDLYEDASTANQVLRPHWDHINADDNSFARFLTAPTTNALSGDTSRVLGPFPFRVDIDADLNDNQAGVWSNPDGSLDPTDPSSTIYEYDVDCDGDGFRDAVWVDLDYPIVDLSDGRQFVPLFAFKVVDMDALLNVNAHGNMNGVLARDSNGNPVSVGDLLTEYVSSSNQALSKSEVNLGLGLNADIAPGEMDQHEQNLGSVPTNVLQLSNYELLMLLNGRESYVENPPSVFNVSSRVEGRWSERDLIAGFYDFANGGSWVGAPAAGAYFTDDDSDSNSFTDDEFNAPVPHPLGGAAYQDPNLFNAWIPPFVHPLDYGGTGSSSVLLNGGVYDRRLKPATTVFGAPQNPLNWLDYTNSPWQHQATSATALAATQVSAYWEAVAAALQVNEPLHDFLLDDGNEIILDRRYRNPDYDAVFPTSEMDGIALSETDFINLGISNRLRSVGIVNLDKGDADQISRVRQRLTTDSWDRYDFGHGRSVNFTEDRDWEFTIWGDGVTVADEFDSATITFPPQFGTIEAGTADDPFRSEVRLLLKSEFGYNDHLNSNATFRRFPRHKLDINRILSGESTAAPASPTDTDRRAFDDEGNPRFRNLTPHPVMDVGDPTIAVPIILHDNVTAGTEHTVIGDVDVAFANIDPTNADIAQRKKAQEWWARYDRQRLARDIYVLLYTLGAGNDLFETTTTVYPVNAQTDLDNNGIHDLVQQMAQFAVNYVDALDRDNVITRFEYDVNLTDGWDITGNNTPSDPDYVTVNGVEAQQLAFSEAIWIRTAQEMAPGNHNRTPWDDEDREHQYLHIELRNMLPFEVELSDETWRIVREEEGALPQQRTARLTFKRNGMVPLTVPPGEVFTIGTNDGYPTDVDSADFYIDHDADPEFEGIVPNGADVDAANFGMELPRTDLDLISTLVPPMSPTNYPNFYDVEVDSTVLDNTRGNNGTGTMVGILNADTTADSTASFDLVLERRRNLQANDLLGQVDDALNDVPADRPDWIEVDRIHVDVNSFDAAGDTETDMQTTLADIVSSYRLEPLSAPHDAHTPTKTNNGDPINHTIMEITSVDRDRANVQNPPDPNVGSMTNETPFELWQPHFDRDFSSIIELFSVPVFGTNELTRRLAQSDTTITGIDKNAMASLAGRLFMDTDPNDDSDHASSTGIEDDNRWYRLLEFVTTADGGDGAIRERLDRIIRTPGRININTVRDEAVLAAILDDKHINRFDAAGFGQTEDTVEAGGGRNWYRELTLARDGVDPLNALGGGPILPLPGVPGVPSDPNAGDIQYGAIPFRSLGYVPPDVTVWSTAQQANRTAHSLLRSHVEDDATLTTRAAMLDQLSLFEARPTADVATDSVDYHTRNRLLAKLANQTTNRSNVFAVWMTIKFFEAHQPDATNQPGVVQIGAELADSPTQRMFYVVDRTLLEDAVQVDDAGTPAITTDDIMTLNWRSFVVHQRTLPSN